MISERIQMLLKSMGSTSGEKKKFVSQMINQAEVILKHLPDADQDALTQYLEHLMDHMAEEEPCLYTG